MNRTMNAAPPRSKRRTSAILALLVLIFLAGATTALAQTPVSACGAEITAPGDYVLTTGLDCGTPAGVFINSGSVNFNLNGHVISSTGTMATGIFVACAGVVTISNGSVSGATNTGILVSCPSPTPTGIVIRDMILSQNKKGIPLFAAGSVTVRDNLIVGTGVTNVIGILLSRSHDNTIRGNAITGNDRHGIQVEGAGGSSNNLIKDNVLNGNGSGIVTIDGDNSQIDGNVTNGNIDRGIWLTTVSTGNTIKKNTATGNPNRDLVDEGDCATNVWFKNTFDTANTCIN